MCICPKSDVELQPPSRHKTQIITLLNTSQGGWGEFLQSGASSLHSALWVIQQLLPFP